MQVVAYKYKVYSQSRNHQKRLEDFLRTAAWIYNHCIALHKRYYKLYYKYALDFVYKALQIVPDGKKVCMFLKVQFLEGKARKGLFVNHPPKVVYVSSSRLLCAPNGDFEQTRKNGGSAVAYAWFVWEKGFKGDTVIKWIN